MAKKQTTYLEFMKRFPDEEACMEHLKRTRYGERHECQSCGKDAKYYRVKKRKAYACEHCGFQVYPMAGTPFENSRTPLHSWFYAMYLFCASRNGVSAKELERQLGVTYKTAWRMARLIRAYMTEVDGDQTLGGPDSEPVEADKAYIGGKDKMGESDKTIVLGMVERDGSVITRVVKNRKEHNVIPHILRWVEKGSRVATDEAPVFGNLRAYGYRHGTVNHGRGQYVLDDVHTNTIEGFWSLFKVAYHGTYVHVSKKYLPLYLGEFEYRWNRRKQPHLMLPTLLTAFAPPVRRVEPSA